MKNKFSITWIDTAFSTFNDFNKKVKEVFPIKNINSVNKITEVAGGVFLNYLTPEETYRTLRHLSAIQSWVETQSTDYLLVIEDSIELDRESTQVFDIDNLISCIPSSFKIVQLEVVQQQPITSIRCTERSSDSWGAGAYIITRHYAKFLLSNLLKNNEFYLMVIDDPGVRPYVENVIFTPAGDSAFTIPWFYVCIEGNIQSTDSSIQSAIHVRNLWKQLPSMEEIFEILDHSNPRLTNQLKISNSRDTRAIVVDNFYEDPYAVRKFALEQEYFDDDGYIGRRTRKQFLTDELKTQFEFLLNKKITKWEEYGMNGRFQHNWAGEKLVYHCDEQRYAAIIYLTPDAPFETGTSTWAHKATRIHHNSHPGIMSCFNQRTFVDRTPYEMVDTFGNVFNRLVIFDGGCIHSATEYFGDCLENCRLWHMFFFDAE